jgi:hypothetical protein
MSVTYLSKGRARARRRRPPNARIIFAWCWVVLILSQTAWVAVQVARGQVVLLACLVIYPFLFQVLWRGVEVAREAERYSRPLPSPSRLDWGMVVVMLFVQAAIWAAALGGALR